MNLDEIARKHQEALVKDLQELIRIPSIRNEATRGKGMPFGRPVADALAWYLAKAEAMGFQTKNVDGYAGHVEYGEGEDILGILVHLDVVPPGQGWDGDPFAAEIKDGKLIGRGVSDNKGPAVAVLHALKAVKESGVALKKRIRIIAGTDEESGMRCVEYYFKHEEQPTLGFSPDADFPLIHAEKGILHLKARWQADGPLVKLTGGERPNVVPNIAQAQISGLNKDLAQLAKEDSKIEVVNDGKDATITAHGRLAHASMPEKGDNAITRILEFLAQLDLGPQTPVIKMLAKAAKGIHGEGLDIALADEVSGKLTCNLGMVHWEEGKGEAVFDVRSPVTLPLENTLAKAKAALESAGFTTEVGELDSPHYVPKDTPLVQTLLKVYREFTGDNNADALAIGGGTYARKLKGGVAFGPLLPGRDDVAHIANEYMLIDDLMLAFKIYTKAMLEIAK